MTQGIWLVHFCGGVITGLLAAHLIHPIRHRLGYFADVVGVSIAVGVTALWMWITG